VLSAHTHTHTHTHTLYTHTGAAFQRGRLITVGDAESVYVWRVLTPLAPPPLPLSPADASLAAPLRGPNGAIDDIGMTDRLTNHKSLEALEAAAQHSTVAYCNALGLDQP
jgi:hypothetical protein